MNRPHADYLVAYSRAGSAAGAARLLGCSRRIVYRHLERAGVPVRGYHRRPTVLRLVTASDPLAEWHVVRKREIDVELRLLRARWLRLLRESARAPGAKGGRL